MLSGCRRYGGDYVGLREDRYVSPSGYLSGGRAVCPPGRTLPASDYLLLHTVGRSHFVQVRSSDPEEPLLPPTPSLTSDTSHLPNHIPPIRITLGRTGEVGGFLPRRSPPGGREGCRSVVSCPRPLPSPSSRETSIRQGRSHRSPDDHLLLFPVQLLPRKDP